MTFIAPSSAVRSSGDVVRPLVLLNRGGRSVGRIRAGDEDGARRALCADPSIPVASVSGTSLEHLARIAFG